MKAPITTATVGMTPTHTLYKNLLTDLENEEIAKLKELEKQVIEQSIKVYERMKVFLEEKIHLVQGDFYQDRIRKQIENIKRLINNLFKQQQRMQKKQDLTKADMEVKKDYYADRILQKTSKIMNTKNYLISKEVEKIFKEKAQQEKKKIDNRGFHPHPKTYTVSGLRRQAYAYLMRICKDYVQNELPDLYEQFRAKVITFLNQPVEEMMEDLPRKLNYKD